MERLEEGQQELRDGQSELRVGQSELRVGQSELRADMRGDLLQALARTNRTIAVSMAATIVGSSTLALAVLRFAG